ncbi:MAG: endopeptidase La [Helicobacteraceae bacterium]|jgi:ATP-dependent Lon protease|nr:endopeptidase La [Helicobacteraceae bacterium]
MENTREYGALPSSIPLIIESDMFLYPFMISPLFFGDERNIAAVNEALTHKLPVLVATTKDEKEGGYYDAGTIGHIMRKQTLPDKRIKVLFQGVSRGKIVRDQVGEKALYANVVEIESEPFDSARVEMLLEALKENVRELVSISPNFHGDILSAIGDFQDANRIIDFVASAMRLKRAESYALIVETKIEKRLTMLIENVVRQIAAAKLQREIKSKVHSRIEQVNREYYLKEQLKQIRKELGEDTQREEEIEEYQKKLDSKKDSMPEEGYKEAKKQLDRLSRMHPDSADSNLLQTYIEWVLEMPFGEFSTHKLSVAAVAKRLEADHFSLKKPKERIVEFFAVRELLEQRGADSKDARGTILCFVGPPGVGKTSLANSIAVALKRELVRIALGGMEDVNELRGHRRTYIGAMPGRIVQGLINAKSMNPVMVLDEIDKVGRTMRGDPTAALLEILDPEQNEHFRDYYLNFAIDLGKVIFIATANDLATIPAPLRDRLEIIAMGSYTPQEKIEIAKRYLIPQELAKHGLKKDEARFSVAAIREMSEKYTKEAGVRNLRRAIASVLRKAAKNLLADESTGNIAIGVENLKEFLDKKVYEIEPVGRKSLVGVINGLAWTPVGGDVLKIEAIKIRAKGGLQLTGSLGDVMKESAQIAYSVVKTLIDAGKIKIDQADIPPVFGTPREAGEERREEDKGSAKDRELISPSEIYNRHTIHLHVPEGATPKDGPSAGVAMACAITSILSGRAAKSDVAMTGELTLTGKILPIGGLKEKLIAAFRAKIKTAIIPQKNHETDLDEIPDEVLDALEIIPVTRIEEVIKIALD